MFSFIRKRFRNSFGTSAVFLHIQILNQTAVIVSSNILTELQFIRIKAEIVYIANAEWRHLMKITKNANTIHLINIMHLIQWLLLRSLDDVSFLYDLISFWWLLCLTFVSLSLRLSLSLCLLCVFFLCLHLLRIKHYNKSENSNTKNVPVFWRTL